MNRRRAAALAAAIPLLMPVLAGTPAVAGASGRPIVFDSTREGNRDVFVMHPDGSGMVRLTDDLADDYAPSWTRIDGTHRRRITSPGAIDNSFPSYKP